MEISFRSRTTSFLPFVTLSIVFGIIFSALFQAPVVQAKKFLSICDEDLELVNKVHFDLPPSFEHFGGPWHSRPHSQLYASRTVDINFNRMFQARIQGLNITVWDLMVKLRADGCLAFVWGGAVRDAILGVRPNDVDLALTCHPGRQKALCVQYFGERNCQRPRHGSSKLAIGRLLDKTEEAEAAEDSGDGRWVTEPVDVAHWNRSFEVNASALTYTINTLAYYPAVPGPDEPSEGVVDQGQTPWRRKVIIDLNGRALGDVCRRRIVIPSRPDFWNEWALEGAPFKLLRFWVLLARGFKADRRTRRFVTERTRAMLTRDAFLQFYCHKLLVGLYQVPVEGGNGGDGQCLSMADDGDGLHAAEARRFRELLREDLGEGIWERLRLDQLPF